MDRARNRPLRDPRRKLSTGSNRCLRPDGREEALTHDPARADLIILGGGLAGALIAWRLRLDRPEVRVRVVEREARLGGVHTWSFFDSDLTDDDRAWLAPAVAHRWTDGHEVHFPARARRLTTPYNSVTSERLHQAVAPMLGDGLITGDVVDADAAGVTLADGRRLSAQGVIDARGPRPTQALQLGWQSFVGRTVRLTRPHGLCRPTIMDATVSQPGAYRFVYLLPFDERTVLVEDTYYADGPELDRPRIQDRLDAYIRSRGWEVEAVIGEEEGVLPIALDGDIDAFWAEDSVLPRAGLCAGLFHPVTGYSLPDAVRLARRVAAQSDLSTPALRALTEGESKARWRERRFYRLLNRMLFRACEPERRWRVFQRFYGLSEPLVRRFYAARSTPLDKLRILAGKPPVPVDRALTQLRETKQGTLG